METITNGYTKDKFNVLYKDDKYILVKSISKNSKYGYGPYSFGLIEDFYSFWSFPVNQSCLHKEEAIKILNRFIVTDKKYLKKFPQKEKNVKVWENMIQILESEA